MLNHDAARRWANGLFVVALLTVAASPAAAGNLFQPVKAPANASAVVDQGVVRHRHVRIDAASIASPGGAARLQLNLFPDVVVSAVRSRFETRKNGFDWVGTVPGRAHGIVSLSTVDGVVAGNVSWPGRSYGIRYAADGVHVVTEIDQAAFPPEACDRVVTPWVPEQEAVTPQLVDDGSIIDIFALYTPNARTAAGGMAAVEARIALGISESNTSFANSAIIQRFRLVGTQETAYTEVDSNTDLQRFQTAGDGFMDEAQGLRNSSAADLMTVIVNTPGSPYCGVAYLMNGNNPGFESAAYSVVEHGCISPNYTFAHELGHNMGLNHAREDGGSGGAYSYSWGYKHPSNTPSESFRDIMSYGSTPFSTRVLHFSNPNVSYAGYPTGIIETDPASAHNALSLNNTRTTVANFRASIPVTPPAISVGDVTVTEGNIGTTTASFTVTLSAEGASEVTVDWGTGASGSATSGTDYVAAGGTLVFPPGQTWRRVAVIVNNDTLDEANENFFVNCTNPTNATLGDGQAAGVIVDNDPTPSLSFTGGPLGDGDRTVTEGNTGTVNATFAVSLSAASGRTVKVTFATGTSGNATSGADYQAKSAILTFNPGETTKTFTVQTIGDTTEEVNEVFYVNLSAASNATIADTQAAGTIVDNDPPPAGSPTVSVSDASITEGNTGTVNAVFTITLSAASANTITVPYTTGTGGTAVSGVDYQLRKGAFTFTPGQTSKTQSVPVIGDLVDEANETFYFNLTSAAFATVLDGQGQGTIIDNE